MTRTKRQRLFTGVYKDGSNVSIVVSIHGKPREFRQDADGKPYRSYPRHTLKDERIRVQARELLKHERVSEKSYTFATDVDRYLATIHAPKHRSNARTLLGYWVRAFGDRAKDTITELEVREAFATFDKKPATRNHIRRELFAFYKTLNGPQGYNPALNLRAAREKHRDTRALSYDTIDAIFATLAPSKSKARLQVMAYTGLPQSLIAKLQPSDLKHLEQGEVQVKPRRKGAGVEGRVLPLAPIGIAALKEFQRLDAFGPFQNRQLTQMLKRAIIAAKVTVPAGTRPYDLRHSFLTEVYRHSGDIRAVAELGMHATLEQAARYASGATTYRATKAIESVPRFGTTTIPAHAGNSGESKGVRTKIKQAGRTPRKRQSPN